MIIFKRGNLFESNARAWINPVNTEGVMGKGLALKFKKTFPQNFIDYQVACRMGACRIGKVHISWRGGPNLPEWIINFPTKREWRKPSELQFIAKGIISLKDFVKREGIGSVAMPALGCGLGGLPWVKVSSLLRTELGRDRRCQYTIFMPWEKGNN